VPPRARLCWAGVSPGQPSPVGWARPSQSPAGHGSLARKGHGTARPGSTGQAKPGQALGLVLPGQVRPGGQDLPGQAPGQPSRARLRRRRLGPRAWPGQAGWAEARPVQARQARLARPARQPSLRARLWRCRPGYPRPGQARQARSGRGKGRARACPCPARRVRRSPTRQGYAGPALPG